jgi:hypothetical protein
VALRAGEMNRKDSCVPKVMGSKSLCPSGWFQGNTEDHGNLLGFSTLSRGGSPAESVRS